ncbi:MAG: hypothetical protein K940chlam2_01762 [Chlamydiae bacterium]|nr:hypothetical protein [Chlamydiota bacterium]
MRIIFSLLLLGTSLFGQISIPVTPPHVVERFYSLLQEVDQLFQEEEITYWAACGSLLGAVRHGAMIPWDDDIDIAILDKDLGKLLSLKKELAKRGLVLCPLADYIKIFPIDGEVIDKENNGMHLWKYPFIDIFPMTHIEGKVNFLSHRLRATLGQRHWFTKEDMALPLPTLSFGPLQVPVPRNSLTYLKRAYGEDVLEVAIIEYDHAREKKRERLEFSLSQPLCYVVE